MLHSKSPASPESGNILIFILMAIMLLAALSFAVTQGSRDSTNNVSDEKLKLLATEVIDYGDTMQKAAAMLRLRGVKFDQISFATPQLSTTMYGTYGTNPSHEIFNPAGGGVAYKKLSNEIYDGGVPSDLTFDNSDEVANIGTTCGAQSCAELILWINNLTKNVCAKINDLLNVTNPNGDPPVGNADVAYAGFTNAYNITIAEPELAGQHAACAFFSAEGYYLYYQVLLER